jgi:hypothetical protein
MKLSERTLWALGISGGEDGKQLAEYCRNGGEVYDAHDMAALVSALDAANVAVRRLEAEAQAMRARFEGLQAENESLRAGAGVEPQVKRPEGQEASEGGQEGQKANAEADGAETPPLPQQVQ